MLGLRNIRDWARRRAMGAASHAGRGSCVTTPAGQIAIPGEDVSTFRERMFSYWASLGHPPATCKMFLADAINTEGYADVASRASRVMGSLSGKSVLDVGCGWGGLSRVLSACGAKVTMLDPHPPHVDVARARVPSATGLAGSGTDLLDLGLQDGSFDHVFVYSVIEHVGLPVDHRGNAEPVLEIQRRVIAEAARVLKPGGCLLISTGNYNFPLDQEVQIWFFHYLPQLVQHEFLAMTGRSADRYGLLTWTQLKDMAEAGGLELASVETCDTEAWAGTLERWLRPLMTPEAVGRAPATFARLREQVAQDPHWMPMWHAFFRKPAVTTALEPDTSTP